jgi:hypothetical protein
MAAAVTAIVPAAVSGAAMVPVAARTRAGTAVVAARVVAVFDALDHAHRRPAVTVPAIGDARASAAHRYCVYHSSRTNSTGRPQAP